MKRIFAVAVAVAIALPVAGFAIAAERKPAPAAPAAAPEPAAAPAAGKAAKPKVHLVTGTIEALDAAAGTFTVKGRKGNVDLKAGGKVKLDSIKVGDKVVVKYAGGTASFVKAAKAKPPKAENAKPKAEAQPAAKPAEKK